MNIRSVFGIVNPQFAAAGSLNFPRTLPHATQHCFVPSTIARTAGHSPAQAIARQRPRRLPGFF